MAKCTLNPFLVKLGDIRSILLAMGMMLIWWRYGSAFRYAFFSKIIATCLCFFFMVSTLSLVNLLYMQVALRWFFKKFLLPIFVIIQMLFPKLKFFGLGPHHNPYMHL